jgi:hypothetical protein
LIANVNTWFIVFCVLVQVNMMGTMALLCLDNMLLSLSVYRTGSMHLFFGDDSTCPPSTTAWPCSPVASSGRFRSMGVFMEVLQKWIL